MRIRKNDKVRNLHNNLTGIVKRGSYADEAIIIVEYESGKTTYVDSKELVKVKNREKGKGWK